MLRVFWQNWFDDSLLAGFTPEHSVLFAQMFDHVELLTVDPASKS